MKMKTNVRQHPRRTRKGITTVTRHERKLMTYPQTKQAGIRLKPYGDVDKDGVRNSRDCRPFDPKKQGFIHDAKMKALRWQEERMEKTREKEERKLNDLKDELKLKKAISEKSMSAKLTIVKEKQAMIDETLREKKALQDVREANRKAKQELSKYTLSGKIGRGLKAAGKGATVGLEAVGKVSLKAINMADKAIKESERKQKRYKTRTKTVRVYTKPKTRVKRKKKEVSPFGF